MPDSNPARPHKTSDTVNFLCGRCNSPLEADARTSGQPARCPNCGADFVVPVADIRERRLVARIDERDNESHSTHAYAADGASAPRILTDRSGNQVIECTRCGRPSPVDADRCRECGYPFTADGFSIRPQSAAVARAAGCLGFGLASAIGVFCAGWLALPLALGALFLGWQSWNRTRPGDRSIRATIVIGALAAFSAIGWIAFSAIKTGP